MSASLVGLLLSAWLGATALFAAVVAPAAFAVLPSRSLAGALVGRVLPIIFSGGIVAAMIGIGLDRHGRGRAPRLRRGALVVMVLACGAAQFVVAPRIDQVRAEIDGAIEALSPDDARRKAFGRLHAISVAWMGVAMLAAGAALVLSVMPATPRPPDGRVRASDAAAAPGHVSR